MTSSKRIVRLKTSRIAIAVTGIAALMIAAGGAAYFMARRSAQDLQPAVAPVQGDTATVVPVNVTASACDPMELSVPAGKVTFSVHNAGARALEWEILNGVMVVDERENIAPGFTQKLTTKLDPGDYDITCGLLSNPKGKLHVAALDAANAKPSQIDLIGPLAEYRVYASYEIDALVEDTKKFAEAVKAGDRDAARALLPSARAHYARIAPLAGLFPELDAAINSPAGTPALREAAPAFAGFRRLRQELSGNSASGDLAAIADKLVTDVAALQASFESLAINPQPTFAGAADVMSKASPPSLAGGADLSDFQANIDGVRKLVDLFHPLIAKADGALSVGLGRDFAALDATMAKYKTAEGAVEPSATLSAEDQTVLQDTTKKLSKELTLLRGALGLS